MSKLRPILAVPVVLALAACSAGAATSPSPSPGGSPDASPSSPASPSPSATPVGIVVDHATGATDVVLRMESGGGFVPIGFIATQAPSFTLYGDGTVIARDDNAPWPDPGPDGLMRLNPFFVGKLSPDEMQDLLRFALGEGGLGVARPSYDAGGVADAPTTTFIVKAGGVDKTVAVNALGFDSEGGPDAQIRKAFEALAERLRAMAADLPLGDQPYIAERWRGVLLEAGMGSAAAPIEWPWPDIDPADFATDEPGGLTFPSRVLTAEEVAALGLGDLGGGVQDIALLAPDGETGHTLSLRPLFPDEAR